jgi:hypothetical protein
MKKWLLATGFLLLLLPAAVFLFFPARQTISESVVLKCNVNAASKFIENESQWAKWWPAGSGGKAGSGVAGESAFTYNGLEYRFAHGLYHTAEVGIGVGDSVAGSQIALIPLDNRDSLLVQWECNLDAGWNPVGRVRMDRHAVEIRSGMRDILSSLRTFLSKVDNVYGIPIVETSTNDTFLVAIRSVLPAYPGTAEIYGEVNKLKACYARQGATQTGYPMLNVTKSPEGQYRIMVAVPVNKTIQGQGDIFSTRLVPGRFLVGEVRGDARAVLAAQDQMQNFISDYHRTAMAIPFQSLVTDRSQEPDSMKWVTRLYYPIF